VKYLMIWFIKGWRKLISPLYGPTCRFYPSCSAYGLEAVTIHGAIKGGAMAVWRILRCNPWNFGGFDPVPGSDLEKRALEEGWCADETHTHSSTGPSAQQAAAMTAGIR
jgi:putative membrane protein insertion efficiency factor